MMRIKIFEGINYVNDYERNRGVKCLEERVEDWLRENHGIKIKHIKQSSHSSGKGGKIEAMTVISIWYDY